MKSLISSLIGLLLSVSVGAEPLLEGRVRLNSGEPVADAQVLIFDLSDLRRGPVARAQTDGTGYFALPLAALTGSVLPARFTLGQNYPNPFNPSTIIPYHLAALSEVRLEVFNLLGQRIATLVDGERPAGFHTATWTATDGAGRAVGAGVYVYRMTVGMESQTGRMVLIDGQAGVSAGGMASVWPGVSGGSGSDGGDAQVYGLVVSGSGLAPYVDSAFHVEADMAPVELVVSAGLPSAGKITDDDCAFCYLFNTQGEEGDDRQEVIPDAKLRAAIAAALGKASGETIAKGEMEALTTLEAEDVGISDLTGLEFATNLTWLSLADNQIADLSALKGLTKLEVLNLSGNQITDISALAGLTKLRWLGLDGLSGNTITDIAALKGLTNLRVLYIGNNQITAISALAGLTNLTHLYLWNNQITDVSALAGLTKLIELFLNDNPLSASSINDHIPTLQARGVAVTFDPTPVTVTDDSTPVTIPDVNLREAIEAALGKARGETITKDEMETLTTLDADDAGISDLTGLEFATNLGDLNFYDNNLTDVSALSGLTNLTVLRLGHNNITDVSALKGLTKLTQLELDFNNVSDLSPLSGLTNLTVLGLGHNNITDVSALQGLTKLISLGLWHNNITDVSALQGLTKLIWLELDYNNITDVSALQGLTKLKNLGLTNNPLSTSSINDHIPALQTQGVTVEFDPTPIDPTPVTIPDANLRAAIEVALGKAKGATITKGEMETLRHLNAKNAGIRDLTGLEFATNLKVLGLYDNRITDVSALSGLTNLTELHLSFNQIIDVSALAGLTNLRILYIGNNQITDVSALAELTNLRHLDLKPNPLNASSIDDHIPALQARGVTVEFDPTPVDPTPVTIPDANLRAAIEVALGKAKGEAITKGEMETLRRLNAEDAGISDLPGLEFATNLTELYLRNNQITDIAALAGLTELKGLRLFGNNLTDVSELAGLTKLRSLHLGNNQITDIAALSGLTNLTYLYLRNNQIADIAALSGLTNLRELSLSDNQITDLSALARLTKLEFLNLWGNQITDISALARLTNLTYLHLRNNQITDLSALARLTNLTELYLNDNQITDISALAGLTKLEFLNLWGNQITDISALARLTNLTYLHLSDNQITDISALTGLTNLTELYLRQNPLSAFSIYDHIPVFQARRVTVTFDPLPDTPVTTITAATTDDPTPVTIPDANLRATIEAALGKASGAIITQGEMTRFKTLEAENAGISDLTGLEFATKLVSLALDDNNITDVSALRGLTNLTDLRLDFNNITDVSALQSLTNLKELRLNVNNITDVSALRGLINLTWLNFHYNNVSDISPLSGLTNLRHLGFNGNNASDISALRSLINLRSLEIWLNNISDISALRDLTNLTWLYLHRNNISDISALRDLTNLKTLGLNYNNVSDVSPLRGLTNLTWLALAYNNITDVSPLRGLTNLKTLGLSYNNITDVSPLRGLTNLELLQLEGNLLSFSSINDHIPALQSSGATVSFDPFHESDFDIELVFLNQFPESQKNVLRSVARRWMAVIIEDLPDYEFTQGWSGQCGDQSFAISAGEWVDDLRVYVTSFDGGGNVFGWGSPHLLREETHLPVLGCMSFDLERANLEITGLHETAHVLGFGVIWDDLGLLQDFSRNDSDADTHFNGPLAIAAFNDAGGWDYPGAKVPVQKMDGVHWRHSVLAGELMVPSGGGVLSTITVQSLGDLGYGVDVSQADPTTLTLPDAASAKARAKIPAAMPSPHGYGMDGMQAGTYTLPGADLHWQGGIAESLSLMPGDDHLRDRQENIDRDFDFDLRDNRLMGRLAPHPQAEPKPLCGLHLRQEPMYVVDQQGYIIRAIGR